MSDRRGGVLAEWIAGWAGLLLLLGFILFGLVLLPFWGPVLLCRALDKWTEEPGEPTP